MVVSQKFDQSKEYHVLFFTSVEKERDRGRKIQLLWKYIDIYFVKEVGEFIITTKDGVVG